MSSQTDKNIGPDATMRDVLEAYPGAQRTLFRNYHIGGCSSCAFSPEETLADLCRRNDGLDPAAVLERIRAGHEEDARVLIEPAELAQKIHDGERMTLLDIRSRAEHEAVKIQGSVLMSQPVTQEILSQGPDNPLVVIIDHQGRQGLDAAAYFIGHGLKNVRCLRGGIDAWSQEVDASVQRYQLA